MVSLQKGIDCAGSSEKSWPPLHAPEQPHPGSTGYPPCRQAGVTAVPVAKQGQLSSPHPTPSSPAHLYGNGPGRTRAAVEGQSRRFRSRPGSVRMCNTLSPPPPPYASPRQPAALGSRLRPGTNSRSPCVQRTWLPTGLRAPNEHGSQPTSSFQLFLEQGSRHDTADYALGHRVLRSSTIYRTGATSGSNHPLNRAAAK